jgi:hypothetical protein
MRPAAVFQTPAKKGQEYAGRDFPGADIQIELPIFISGQPLIWPRINPSQIKAKTASSPDISSASRYQK